MATAGGRPEGAGEHTGRGKWAGQAAAAGRGGVPAGFTCDGMRRIALEEMALRRRRLGELTSAQERVLESLMMSVADNISALVSAVGARVPDASAGKEVYVPEAAKLEAEGGGAHREGDAGERTVARA